jgi:hypothetical protein
VGEGPRGRTLATVEEVVHGGGGAEFEGADALLEFADARRRLGIALESIEDAIA